MKALVQPLNYLLALVGALVLTVLVSFVSENAAIVFWYFCIFSIILDIARRSVEFFRTY